MSSGIVMCEGCRREVHQWGPKVDGVATWIHCDDRSPICKGAHAVYPRELTDLRGPFCGCDKDGDIPEFTYQPAPAPRPAPKVRFSKGSFKPIAKGR